MNNSNGTNVMILLVEDDEGHAELVRINLVRSGMKNEIMTFNSGNKAIEFLDDQKDQDCGRFLMILDLNMPGMDGHQVLDRIKNDRVTKKIPVIILTTATDQREIDRCYGEGCNIYIAKPVDYEQFSKAIQDLGGFLQNVIIPGIESFEKDAS